MEGKIESQNSPVGVVREETEAERKARIIERTDARLSRDIGVKKNQTGDLIWGPHGWEPIR